MKYLDKTFAVATPGTDEYRDNWDRIFGPKADPIWPVTAPEDALPRFAPEGSVWVCLACGKTQPHDLYKFRDESCVINAVLVPEGRLLP